MNVGDIVHAKAKVVRVYSDNSVDIQIDGGTQSCTGKDTIVYHERSVPMTLGGTMSADGEIKTKQVVAPQFPPFLAAGREPIIAVDADGKAWLLDPNEGTYFALTAG